MMTVVVMMMVMMMAVVVVGSCGGDLKTDPACFTNHWR